MQHHHAVAVLAERVVQEAHGLHMRAYRQAGGCSNPGRWRRQAGGHRQVGATIQAGGAARRPGRCIQAGRQAGRC